MTACRSKSRDLASPDLARCGVSSSPFRTTARNTTAGRFNRGCQRFRAFSKRRSSILRRSTSMLPDRADGRRSPCARPSRRPYSLQSDSTAKSQEGAEPSVASGHPDPGGRRRSAGLSSPLRCRLEDIRISALSRRSVPALRIAGICIIILIRWMNSHSSRWPRSLEGEFGFLLLRRVRRKGPGREIESPPDSGSQAVKSGD